MARVTQAELARLERCARSTVSRWIAKHPALADDQGLVDPDEYRQHRAQIINPGNQTKGAQAIPDGPSGNNPSLNDHRTRRAKADAAEAELDLAERLGMTLRRDQVEAAAADAGEVLKQKAAQLVRDKAEHLCRIEDAREMELALRDVMDELLRAGAMALRAMAEDRQGADAA